MMGMAATDRELEICPRCGKRQLVVTPVDRRCLAPTCRWRANGGGVSVVTAQERAALSIGDPAAAAKARVLAETGRVES